MYLTYEEYAGMGGKVEDFAFPRLAYMASKKIDRYTQSRVKAMGEIPQAVKMCVFELVNALFAADPVKVASEAQLSGFSNDGYSESYAEALTPEKLEYNLYGIIKDFLSDETNDEGVPLLYVGVDK